MFAQQVATAFFDGIKDHRTDAGWEGKKEDAYQRNKWFTRENIDQSLNQWYESLRPEAVEQWLKPYKGMFSQRSEMTVGLIMAGNIPLVGMHDVLCCLAAGFRVRIKMSSDDEVLPKFWIEQAVSRFPDLEPLVLFSENMKEIDAAIATGSNNSARYFEYYFRNKPLLLRRNRNSVSVLRGDESNEEIIGLGHDVFDFFGLGCRNVTHLLLPRGYEFKPLFDGWEVFANIANHNKYVNNYHYHRALLLMNLDPHLDNGFVLLKEKPEVYSPVGMLNYSFYDNLTEVQEFLKKNAEGIQCITSQIPDISHIKLGDAQKTMLWDYADGKDTMLWLNDLS